MSERFDDIIRKQLEGLESPVPKGMFDKIQASPDVSDATFDAGTKNKLQSLQSPVSDGIFDKIATGADITNAPLDVQIQSKLINYQSAVPADMWERIMQRKRRRRPIAWWWMAASLLLLLGGGTWYAIQQKGKHQLSSGQQAQLDKNIVSAEKPAAPVSNSPVQKDIVHLQKDTVNLFNPISTNTDKNERPVITVSPFNSNKKLQKPVEVGLEKTIVTNSRKSSRNRSNKGYVYEKNGWKTVLDDPKQILNAANGQDATQTEDFIATMSTVHLAIIQQLRSAARLSPGQLLKAKPRSPVIPCPVNADDNSNNWYADVYTSAFLVNKNIADKLGAKNVKDGFDSTLHRQVSYNAGINLVKNISENVLLKTGVQYNRLNESFRLTRINERKLVTTISIRTVIIAPGDTVYIRDTSVTEYIGKIQRRRQNTYQQWDVPVIIGYEFGGENIRLNANAGIIANIRSAYNGEMLDTTQQIINAKNFNGKPIYKTNVGLSLYAGLSIVKPLGERTSLLIEPFARIGLGNTTTQNAWFRQKNSAAGLSIGLRYKLNGAGQRR